ncbi:hypothetical protein Fmac_011618 [Flemingia macrophylla]|uniref:Uncharacterized protein n=1 Tax=Flemingia macrophylla TaxID=520843 RepID=A0ABD1MNT9_9FABA
MRKHSRHKSDRSENSLRIDNQVQARGHGGSGWVSQGEPKVELCVQKKINPNSEHR